VIIEISGRRIRVDETVPYDEVLPSPDGYFWRCHLVQSKGYNESMDYNDLFNDANVVDGERRCFFAPPQTL